MPGKGYIKLHRSLLDCFLWDSEEKHNRRSAWIDLLLLANHSEKKLLFDNEIMVIKKGQYLTSIRKLSSRWGWSVNTTKAYLDLLERDGMIRRKSTNKCTLVDIVNYEKYQGFSDFTEEGVDTHSDTLTDTPIDTHSDTQTAHRLTPNNKLKNVNNKERYITRFEETYKIYPRKGDKKRAYACYQARLKEGYSEDELFTATKNYADYCEKEKREQKYIKMATTFFGVNTPFVDYLGEQKSTPVNGPLDYEIDNHHTHPQIPPYFGFPKEWFDNEIPVRERFKPIKQIQNFSVGVTDEILYSVDELWDKYNLRKRGYENGQF